MMNRGKEMSERWSPTEVGMLTEMWLCGASSRAISQILPRTRNAVMGRVDKSGLMGWGGDGVMPRDTDTRTAARLVTESFEDLMGRPRTADDMDDVCAVILAMVADGRRSRRIAQISGVSPTETARVSAILDDTELWTLRGAPPAAWWQRGPAAFRETVSVVHRCAHLAVAA